MIREDGLTAGGMSGYRMARSSGRLIFFHVFLIPFKGTFYEPEIHIAGNPDQVRSDAIVRKYRLVAAFTAGGRETGIEPESDLVLIKCA